MKLEIYRFELRSTLLGSTLEYTTFLNDILIGNDAMEKETTPVEDTDKVVTNMVLHNLANNLDEAIIRLINAPLYRYLPRGDCIYTSSSDKVLKELEIKLKMKAIEGDFK